jgi:hypothetical protein
MLSSLEVGFIPMNIILSLIGIVGSLFMIKYRERIGEMFGEADWMVKVGGIYNLVIIVAIFIFFWSIASLTGTTGILFKPFLYLIPGLNHSAPQQDFIVQ